MSAPAAAHNSARRRVEPAPLSETGRWLVSLIVFGLAAIWAFSFYASAHLPARVVTHFDAGGAPTSYGPPSTFLIIPAAFSIAPLLMIVIVAVRFRLLNDYPYLVNLPAFFAEVWALPPERQSAWVNTYFDRVLALGAALTLFMLALVGFLYQGMLEERLSTWFLPFVVSFPIVLVVAFLASLQRLSRRVREESIGAPPR